MNPTPFRGGSVNLVVIEPVGEGEEPKDLLPLNEPGLRLLRTLDPTPSRVVLQLSKKVAERPSIDTVTKFLLVETHRAAIQWLEDLIAKVLVVLRIDYDASDGSVHKNLARGPSR